ncbi:hypothetical protein AWQ21_04645 [Picosynechococcus sp. PCC 7003]|uniref:HepT-like ribonuclease domain-containing protein n=1 Tax=Picosynechococcus sp. PCC 7003 TaxID=374981 RepID=UPI000810763E|nr:DUF86 domain-containing protein [Picosynechococcus sp. PCC 7003]ANV83729.1 hypothetical protein AWQ21_04645 [Picosynechococcus sp. PCC 7003]
MSKIDDFTRLKHIQDSARLVLQFTAGRTRDDLASDEMLSLALVRLVEIIGEAANHISLDVRDSHPEVPWRQMIGMRNRLIHGYFDVDLDILWVVVSHDIADLLININKIVTELEDS